MSELSVLSKAVVVNALDATLASDFDRKYMLRLKEGGVTATCLGCCVGSTVEDMGHSSLSRAVEEVGRWYQRVREIGSQNVMVAENVKDIHDAKYKGKIALILSPQDSLFIGKDLFNLEILKRIGVRIMQPTYQRRNQFGDGCAEKVDAGLSKLGVRWVEEMNRLNMVISLSHAGTRTSLEVIDMSKDPVVFTHSNVRSICNHIRNVTDDQIRACTEKGGVIGLTLPVNFVAADKGPREVGVEDYLDHIDYIVKLVGVKHVGIGLDLEENVVNTKKSLLKFRKEYYGEYPDLHSSYAQKIEDEFLQSDRELIPQSELLYPWFPSVAKMAMLVKALLARGYSEQDTIKILGENFLRVFERVWGS